MSELGWAGIFIEEDHGGQGLGIVELVILMEELGYALAPVPFLSNAAAASRSSSRARRAGRSAGCPASRPAARAAPSECSATARRGSSRTPTRPR